MNATAVLSALGDNTVAFDNVQISQAFDLLRRRQSNLMYQVAGTFKPGDKVKFNGRYNEQLEGVVTKVNQKTVSVRTPSGNWRVGSTLLRRVDS